jgi:hypothetical protein
MKGTPVAAALALSLAAPAAGAETPPRRALELSASWGASRMLRPSQDQARELSARNGGLALGARLLLRTTEALSPLLDVGFTPLYRSDEVAPTLPSSPPATVRSSLASSHVLAGLALGDGWLRPWLALGAYRLQVRSTLGGTTISPSVWTYGYGGGLDATLLRRGPIRVGLQARVLVLSEAETIAATLGAVISSDLVAW